MARRRKWTSRKAIERLLRLVVRLAHGNGVTVAHIMDEHQVSRATARRDIALLETLLPCRNQPIDHTNGAYEVRLIPGARALPAFTQRKEPHEHAR